MSELGTAPLGTPLREVLICAGLDPSGGAGLIADVRVVSALGARAVGVVTAATVQNTTGMRSSHPTETDVFETQLAALLSDVEVHAVKIGLLGAIEIARAIGEGLHLTAAPVVWDPIFGATLGGVSFDRAMFDEALRELAPHLTLITPNLDELRALSGSPIVTLADAVGAATELVGRTGAAVLVKGGHFGGADSIDVLVEATRVEELRGSRVPGGEHVHGTGCALSTAIATHLALGVELVEACRAAKAFVATRIASPVRPGRGAPAIL